MEVSPCSKASACVLDMPGRNDIGLMIGVVVEEEEALLRTVDVDVEDDVVEAENAVMGRPSNKEDVK